MIVAVLFLITCGIIRATPVFNSDIVSSAETYPFVVKLHIWENIKLEKSGKIVINPTHCTGFLITLNAVVTAAHCLDDEYGEPTVVVAAGAVDTVKGNVKKIKMIGYKKHKDYQPGDDKKEHIKNDIAIIWLAKKFDRSSKIAPAELDCNDEDYTNKIGTVMGWGATGAAEDTTTLRKGQMQVISAANCKKFAQQSPGDKTFCALVGSRNQYPGGGDSGGPFVIDGAVVGINSWLPTFNLKGPKEIPKISVFVKVEEYIDFLNYNLKNGPPNARKPATSQSQLKITCDRPQSRPGSPTNPGGNKSNPNNSGSRIPAQSGSPKNTQRSPIRPGGSKPNTNFSGGRILVQSGSPKRTQGSSTGSKDNTQSNPIRKNNGK